jgi:TRAP-type C4-dicarboxylate transport system permease small subunit
MTPTTIPHAPPARGPANPLLRLAGRALGLLRLAVSSIVVVLFVTMTASTLIQVAGRYVFGYAIAWTTEVATFSQIWLVFLASGIAMRYGMHIGVDVLAGMLPPPVQRLLAIVLGLASLVFLWVIFDGSLAIVDMGQFQTSPLLQVSMSNIYLAIPIGVAYLALEYLVVIGRLLMGREPFERHAAEDSHQ